MDLTIPCFLQMSLSTLTVPVVTHCGHISLDISGAGTLSSSSCIIGPGAPAPSAAAATTNGNNDKNDSSGKEIVMIPSI